MYMFYVIDTQVGFCDIFEVYEDNVVFFSCFLWYIFYNSFKFKYVNMKVKLRVNDYIVMKKFQQFKKLVCVNCERHISWMPPPPIVIFRYSKQSSPLFQNLQTYNMAELVLKY